MAKATKIAPVMLIDMWPIICLQPNDVVIVKAYYSLMVEGALSA